MVDKIIIDGTYATLGRLSSYVAKQALLGREVIIINANKAIILGNKKEIVAKYLKKIKMGGSGLKGPKIIRSPERILKRTIRGMLSHKQARGSDALKRVKCYNDMPAEYKDVKKIIAGKEKKSKYITLKELCLMLK